MTRVVLLILAALGLGIFAGVGTLYVQQASTEQALAKYEKVLVLFAVEDVTEGTTLFEATTLGQLEYQLFPAEFLPDSALLEKGDTETDSVATHFIPKGTLVLEGDFQQMQALPDVTSIKPQYVALSLYLTGPQRGAGLVEPGDEVGVLSTQLDPELDVIGASVLFQSVKVLAIDGQTEPGGILTGGRVTDEAIVTLEVPENSVGLLLEAYSNGDITLVLLVEGQKLPVFQKG